MAYDKEGIVVRLGGPYVDRQFGGGAGKPAGASRDDTGLGSTTEAATTEQSRARSGTK